MPSAILVVHLEQAGKHILQPVVVMSDPNAAEGPLMRIPLELGYEILGGRPEEELAEEIVTVLSDQINLLSKPCMHPTETLRSPCIQNPGSHRFKQGMVVPWL